MATPKEELERLRWEQIARGLDAATKAADAAHLAALDAQQAAETVLADYRRSPLRILLDAFVQADWKGRAAILALPCLTLLLIVVIGAGESPIELIRALGALWHDCPPTDPRRSEEENAHGTP
ncbi:MAG: hypothetical protein EBR73_16495 [Rhodobacteraceae bacterium]|nr:hypothetical protein [Paracoccaceae bacterium]